MELSRRFDGKKYMWDGETYSGETQARQVMSTYESADFRTELVSEDSAFYVFTRREVKETIAQAQP